METQWSCGANLSQKPKDASPSQVEFPCTALTLQRGTETPSACSEVKRREKSKSIQIVGGTAGLQSAYLCISTCTNHDLYLTSPSGSGQSPPHQAVTGSFQSSNESKAETALASPSSSSTLSSTASSHRLWWKGAAAENVLSISAENFPSCSHLDSNRSSSIILDGQIKFRVVGPQIYLLRSGE